MHEEDPRPPPCPPAVTQNGPDDNTDFVLRVEAVFRQARADINRITVRGEKYRGRSTSR
jgi:hypothetical protein